MGLPFLWHPCGTRDTLPERVPALYTKGMWHPCTLKSEISRARARESGGGVGVDTEILFSVISPDCHFVLTEWQNMGKGILVANIRVKPQGSKQ